MAIFRVERNRGYTVMSNHHLRNKELPLKAKGLLLQKATLQAGIGEAAPEMLDALTAEPKQRRYSLTAKWRQPRTHFRAASTYIVAGLCVSRREAGGNIFLEECKCE